MTDSDSRFNEMAARLQPKGKAGPEPSSGLKGFIVSALSTLFGFASVSVVYAVGTWLVLLGLKDLLQFAPSLLDLLLVGAGLAIIHAVVYAVGRT